MKKFILSVLFILIAAKSQAALSMVHVQHYGENPGAATTLAMPGEEHLAGTLIVVLIYPITTVTGVTNTAGDTFVNCGSWVCWYTPNSNGNASDIVTITYGSSTAARLAVTYNISGADTTSPLGTLDYTGGGSGPQTSATLNYTGVTNGINLVFAWNGSGETWTAGSGYTLVQFYEYAAQPYFMHEYKIVSTPEAASASLSPDGAWGMLPVSFKEAGAGGTITPKGMLLGVGP